MPTHSRSSKILSTNARKVSKPSPSWKFILTIPVTIAFAILQSAQEGLNQLKNQCRNPSNFISSWFHSVATSILFNFLILCQNSEKMTHYILPTLLYMCGMIPNFLFAQKFHCDKCHHSSKNSFMSHIFQLFITIILFSPSWKSL